LTPSDMGEISRITEVFPTTKEASGSKGRWWN
jgi:hypothetical protein